MGIGIIIVVKHITFNIVINLDSILIILINF